MAERRMFAKTIIDSDAFLDMPLSTQALYFHLSMRADDEGFVNKPKRVQKYIGASDDDLKLLIAKRFILTFESGVIVIKHWKIHNYIQKDRFKPTVYVHERACLMLSENNAYTECLQNGYKLYPQDRLEMISENKILLSITHARAREYLERWVACFPGQKAIMKQLHGEATAAALEDVLMLTIELCKESLPFADKLVISDDTFLQRCAVAFVENGVVDKRTYLYEACMNAKRVR